MFELLNRLSISVGRIFNTPVIVHWTLTLAILLVGILNPHYLGIAFCVFGIVALHELGHVFAGQQVNIYSTGVYLTPLGGVALFPVSRPSVKDELVYVLGGPLVNVALILPLWLLTYLSPFWILVAKANLFLLVFNLLPSFPMDGGRLLRAGLFWWTGDYIKATTIAVLTSKFVCVVMGTVGCMTLNFSAVLIAFLVFQMADGETAKAQAIWNHFNGSSGGLSIPEGSTPHNEVIESANILRSLRRKVRNINR